MKYFLLILAAWVLAAFPAAATPDFNKGLVVGQVIADTPVCSPQPCTISSTLAAPPGMSGPFQWYNGGVAIGGATSSTYAPGTSGTYTVSGTVNGVTVTSGGNTYVAKAVHFDWQKSGLFITGSGNCMTSLDPCAAGPPLTLTADYGAGTVNVTDTSHITVSVWIRSTPFTASAANGGKPETFINADLADNVEAGGNSETYAGQGLGTDINAGIGNLRINMGSQPASTGFVAASTCNSQVLAANMPNTGNWTHILYSMDGSVTGTQFKNMAIYVNDVLQAQGCTTTNGLTAAFLVAISNQNGWQVFNQLVGGNANTADLSEIYANEHQSVVCTGAGVPFSQCNGQTGTADGDNNTIPAVIRAGWSDSSGNPVNLGPNCSTPTGSAPEFCFRGDATAFATNQGVVNNTFNTPVLYNASYGPGANGIPAHTVLVKGIYGEIAASTTSLTTLGTGLPIKAGDLIVQYLDVYDNTVVNHNLSCPSGYTQQIKAASNASSQMDVIACSKLAAIDGDSDVVTWAITTGSTRGTMWETAVFSGVNPTTPIGPTAVNTSGASSVVAPSVSGTAGQTLLNIWNAWGTIAQDGIAPPSTQNRIFTNAFTNGTLVMTTEPVTATGATGTRTATMLRSDGSVASSILINPN